MSIIQPPFRRATINDASTLAQFVEFASEGLAVYLWTKIAGGGPDPWHIGRERVASETGGLSYRNAVIAELAGQPISGLISYPLGDKAEHMSDSLPGFGESGGELQRRPTSGAQRPMRRTSGLSRGLLAEETREMRTKRPRVRTPKAPL